MVKKLMVLHLVLYVCFFVLCSCATTTGIYYNSNGKQFEYSWKTLFKSEAPYSFYNDTFDHSEVVKTYNKTETTFIPGVIGGVIVSTPDGGASVVGDERRPSRTEFWIYKITVTRYWYKRTTYYADALPTVKDVYEDKENKMLIDHYSQTND